MSGGIFIIQSDGDLVELNEKAYDSESVLQDLLATYPNLLAGNQINSENPRRWLLITREMGVPLSETSGNWMSVDHLFLDQDSVPTLVEVKRSTDIRIRREVVGQMLDYAANAVVYWPIEAVRTRFEDNCQKKGLDPQQVLSDFLELDASAEDFWQHVQDNLRAGKVRLIFVADVIPPELQRVVEFLNEQMSPAEVLAVEIKQYAGKSIKTLVPRVIGMTAKADQKKEPSMKRQWDEASFFEELERRNGEKAADPARKILDWCHQKKLRIWWGQGAVSGGVVPVFDYHGVGHQLFAMYTYGSLEFYFQYYQKKQPFQDKEKRKELWERLNEIEGIDIPENGLERRPSIPLTILDTDEKLAQFFAVFEWFLKVIGGIG